jgi:hypothetical protein
MVLYINISTFNEISGISFLSSCSHNNYDLDVHITTYALPPRQEWLTPVDV